VSDDDLGAFEIASHVLGHEFAALVVAIGVVRLKHAKAIDSLVEAANIVEALLAKGSATATEVSDSQVVVEMETSLHQGQVHAGSEVKAGSFQVPFYQDHFAGFGASFRVTGLSARSFASSTASVKAARRMR
jgi:hypothetical protein